jgi:UrcA family protein
MYRFATTMMIVAAGLGYQLANAAPSDDVPSVVVRFTDQDLAHIDGVAALYRRLKDAAKTVCAAQDGPRYKSCWQSALSAAVAKVDGPALTAYYRAQLEGRNATIQIAQK